MCQTGAGVRKNTNIFHQKNSYLLLVLFIVNRDILFDTINDTINFRYDAWYEVWNTSCRTRDAGIWFASRLEPQARVGDKASNSK